MGNRSASAPRCSKLSTGCRLSAIEIRKEIGLTIGRSDARPPGTRTRTSGPVGNFRSSSTKTNWYNVTLREGNRERGLVRHRSSRLKTTNRLFVIFTWRVLTLGNNYLYFRIYIFKFRTCAPCKMGAHSAPCSLDILDKFSNLILERGLEMKTILIFFPFDLCFHVKENHYGKPLLMIRVNIRV